MGIRQPSIKRVTFRASLCHEVTMATKSSYYYLRQNEMRINAKTMHPQKLTIMQLREHVYNLYIIEIYLKC